MALSLQAVRRVPRRSFVAWHGHGSLPLDDVLQGRAWRWRRASTAVGLLGGLWATGMAGAIFAPSALAAGNWSVVASPDAGAASSANNLNGVSCPSATRCTAVGSFENASHGYSGLVEQWGGSKWSIVPSPNEPATSGSGPPNDELSSVSCASTGSCMAVGGRNGGSLAEHWDGSKWSLVSAPGVVLNSVSCTSPSACTAVGYFDTSGNNNGGRSKTLVVSWSHGSKWSVVPSPNQGPASAYTGAGAAHDLLNGVSCASAASCAAVGIYVTPAGDEETLAEHWDGKKWSIVPSPDASSGPAASNVLNAVSCGSPRSCVAVGYYDGSAGGFRTLVESWDGTKWSRAASPNEGRANLNDNLTGVSCSSSGSCVAVGYAGGSAVGGGYALVESGAGTKWSIEPSTAEGPASALAGVSCPPQGQCVAVGSYKGAGAVYRTLVERP